MASKTGRKANAASAKSQPAPKDDGRRFRVMDLETRTPVYLPAGGLTESEAVRVATGLVAPAYIAELSA